MLIIPLLRSERNLSIARLRVMATLHSELAERDDTLRLLSATQVHLVRLAGLAPSPSARAHLLWNPAARTGLLLTSGLPQSIPNRTYELWAIAGNKPLPAGIFDVDVLSRKGGPPAG